MPDRPPFANALRDWRTRRRMSQLDLALEAGISARHLAFLETGRAKPSRDMVGQLMAALEVPLRDRNDLLLTAGFAPAYEQRPLDDADLKPLRDALDRLLERHAPYPGILLDRTWNIVGANTAAAKLFALIGGDPDDANILTRLANSDRTAEVIENWPSLAAEFAQRLKTEALRSADHEMIARLEAFREQVTGAVGDLPSVRDDGPLLCARFRLPNGARMSLFSVVGQFSAAHDLTAADLRFELFFPADDASRKILESLAI
jgi:transcriptional regulator with XRE-family HTH domain